ncbi:hypothetical protein RFI_32395, partial [Reticulomyxa filosa]
IIAACNPYRPRKVQTSDITNKNDPLSKWMYRVVPLCDTMKEYVWPFGQLSKLDEKQYIQAMTKQIKFKFDKNTVVYKKIQQWEFKIAEDISASHCLLRKHLANEFIVSLRDVSRCLNFFHWLMQQYETILEKDETLLWTDRALNIALGLCYYFRLDERGRTMYNNLMHQRNKRSFSKLLDIEIRNLSKSFEIPPQIALHNTLKENLFILFFCVATSTPVIVVGKPGTSKTLSLQILLDTLSHRNIKHFNQKLKDNQFHFNVKPLQYISFQGTKNCKPSTIKELWDHTERYSNDKTITTLLIFDEIGLAEQSPHNPLKILHQLLEHPKISFVGISNWSLDAAKMNRMIMHSIPLMDHNGLMETAISILENSNSTFLDQAIINIITVYERIMKDQTNAFKLNGNSDFFGARDFYALIKHQATHSEGSNKQSLEGYFRNFGGLDHNDYRKKLSRILKEVLNRTESEVIRELKKWTPVMCVERNLMEKKRGQSSDDLMVSRHCMIISEEYYSWQLLLEYNILNFNQIFLFGSYFPQDKYSNISNYNQLNKIIDCMDTGKTVILHNLKSIHESLYDMLNQRYQTRPSGNVYCRVALGTESRDCFVHENFKCVIVVQKEDAHSNMP